MTEYEFQSNVDVTDIRSALTERWPSIVQAAAARGIELGDAWEGQLSIERPAGSLIGGIIIGMLGNLTYDVFKALILPELKALFGDDFRESK